MKVADLDYDLPADRIAQTPVEPRDAARLMMVRRADAGIEHRTVTDLPGLLRRGDAMVVNQTRVLPARFTARRATGGRVDALFVRQEPSGGWKLLLNGRGRLKVGDTLSVAPRHAAVEAGWTMRLVERLARGMWLVDVAPADSPERVLARVGLAPLPPYIRRDAAASERGDASACRDSMDRERYQTVFAVEPGAIAAPTAGLHFTPQLLDRLREDGVAIAGVTLHVGLGTFQPVEVEDLGDHPMHEEWYHLPAVTADLIERTRSRGGRVVAVGTTTVRVLETCIDAAGHNRPGEGWTRLLIQPPYEIRSVDMLLTNFHLPRSTLLALVCAFAGRELIMRAYSAAIAAGYRFYSYGDAMLIE